MGNTTFSGPVRSEAGFETVSKNATTGAVTVTSSQSTGSSPVTAGSGFTGTGTIYESSVNRDGTIIRTRIMIDLTGLSDGGTTLDIIGGAALANCHIGQITAAVNGTIFATQMTCLEAPLTARADIDLYSAVEATGTNDDLVTGLTETLLVNGGAQTLGKVTVGAGVPAADEYLYLAGVGAASALVYTAGKLIVDLYGYDA